MESARELLETYLEAKDLNRPDLILDCYAPNAVLTFSIATATISFPARISGADAIAQTLVRDFRKTFTQCKTYYVCESVDADSRKINKLPWLVVMKEVSRPILRLGKGYYTWQFELGDRTRRVSAMHIHIERMDAVEDPDEDILHALQSALPYPWLRPATLRAIIEALMDRGPRFTLLENFKAPVGV
ncbi:MAG: hypothetical protein ACREUQ_15100 [Burkholderiales bacterium]